MGNGFCYHYIEIALNSSLYNVPLFTLRLKVKNFNGSISIVHWFRVVLRGGRFKNPFDVGYAQTSLPPLSNSELLNWWPSTTGSCVLIAGSTIRACVDECGFKSYSVAAESMIEPSVIQPSIMSCHAILVGFFFIPFFHIRFRLNYRVEWSDALALVTSAGRIKYYLSWSTVEEKKTQGGYFKLFFEGRHRAECTSSLSYFISRMPLWISWFNTISALIQSH